MFLGNQPSYRPRLKKLKAKHESGLVWWAARMRGIYHVCVISYIFSNTRHLNFIC